MKKVLLVLFSLLAVSTYAQKLKLVSGDYSVLQQNVTASVEFDFDNTTWEEGQSFADFCGDDYEQRIMMMEQAFIDRFNLFSKTMKVEAMNEKAPYKLVVHTRTIYRRTGSSIGSFCIQLFGTIDIIDVAKNETICVLNFDKLKGIDSYVPDQRLKEAYYALGRMVAKMKIK